MIALKTISLFLCTVTLASVAMASGEQTDYAVPLGYEEAKHEATKIQENMDRIQETFRAQSEPVRQQLEVLQTQLSEMSRRHRMLVQGCSEKVQPSEAVRCLEAELARAKAESAPLEREHGSLHYRLFAMSSLAGEETGEELIRTFFVVLAYRATDILPASRLRDDDGILPDDCHLLAETEVTKVKAFNDKRGVEEELKMDEVDFSDMWFESALENLPTRQAHGGYIYLRRFNKYLPDASVGCVRNYPRVFQTTSVAHLALFDASGRPKISAQTLVRLFVERGEVEVQQATRDLIRVKDLAYTLSDFPF